MSDRYDEHLKNHRAYVRKAFYWIRKSLPDLLIDIPGVNYEWIIYWHDDSKTIPGEYEAYDEYLYGERTKEVIAKYRVARLNHIHSNPHHWQYWVLVDESTTILDMPYEYIIEMICDWWSFSWEQDDLFLIFDWYAEHKDKIKFSRKTKKTVEEILRKLEAKIIKVRGPRK